MAASEHLKRIAEIRKSTENEALGYCEKVWTCPQYRATPGKTIAKALERLGPHAAVEEVARVAVEIWITRERGKHSDNTEN
jgi:hypothetical protein